MDRKKIFNKVMVVLFVLLLISVAVTIYYIPFGKPMPATLKAATPELRAGDIDGDLDKDVISGNGIVYVNTGNGLDRKVISDSEVWDRDFVLHDIDGDRKDEIIAMARGHGDGSPLYAWHLGADLKAHHEVFNDTHGLHPIGIADLDGDGTDEVVNYEDTGVHQICNFDRGSRSRGYGMYGFADFDEDGAIDIASVQRGQDLVCLLLNDGNGSFANGTKFLEVGLGTNSLTVLDVNRDGLMDIAAAAETDNFLRIFTNEGDLKFVTSDDNCTTPTNLDSADMDWDGDTDIVIWSKFKAYVTVLFNDGAGKFDWKDIYRGMGTVAPENSHVLVDVSGDSYKEVIFHTNGIKFLSNDSNVLVVWNDGTGCLCDFTPMADFNGSLILIATNLLAMGLWFLFLYILPRRVKIGPAQEVMDQQPIVTGTQMYVQETRLPR